MTKKAPTIAGGKKVKAKRAIAETKWIETKRHETKRIKTKRIEAKRAMTKTMMAEMTGKAKETKNYQATKTAEDYQITKMAGDYHQVANTAKDEDQTTKMVILTPVQGSQDDQS